MDVVDKPYTVRKLEADEYNGVAKRLYEICQKEFTVAEWQFLPSILINCGVTWNMACGVDVETMKDTVDSMIDGFEQVREDGVN